MSTPRFPAIAMLQRVPALEPETGHELRGTTDDGKVCYIMPTGRVNGYGDPCFFFAVLYPRDPDGGGIVATNRRAQPSSSLARVLLHDFDWPRATWYALGGCEPYEYNPWYLPDVRTSEGRWDSEMQEMHRRREAQA